RLDARRTLKSLVADLRIKTTLLGNTVSNTVPFVGMIPNDRVRILNELDSAIKNAGEKELRRYRDSIRSL
ncbi:radical SAM protein, partial [Bacteroides stercoris]